MTKPTIDELRFPIPVPQPNFHVPHYMLKKEGMYTCGVCGHVFGKALERFIIGNVTECLSCHSPVTVKRITKATNWRNLETEYRMKVAQVVDGKIVFTQHEVVHSVGYDLKERVEMKEIERTVMFQKRVVTIYLNVKMWRYGNLSENWRDRRPKMTHEILPHSWADVLKTTEVKYTGIGEWLDNRDTGYWGGLIYVAYALRNPWIELVKKGGMMKLYEDLIQGRGDGRLCAPGNIKRYRAKLKNRGADWLSKRRYADLKKMALSDDILDELNLERLKHYNECLTDVDDKLVRYMKSCQIYDPASVYADYVNMMAKIGTPVDDATRYPKDLNQAHDGAVAKFNVIKQQLENDTYKTIRAKLKKLEWTDGVHRIVLPKDVQAILDEGKALKHCVGSYVDKVVKVETVILFVRQADKPDEPYYTMEYKNNQIIQCRGDENQPMTEEVQAFTKAWEKRQRPKRAERKSHEEIRAC